MLPSSQKALQLTRAPEDAPKGTPHTVAVRQVPVPPVQPGQVLVRVLAAGFNRRDEWSRHGLYPGLVYEDSTLGCDAAGVVLSPSTGVPQGGLVLPVPLRGWDSDPLGPGRDATDAGPNELGGRGFGLLGATKPTGGKGTFCEYLVLDEDQVVPAPKHLDAVYAAALPCAATTAYRALFTKGQLAPGQNVLITGIGGGVAQLAAQMARAIGAKVYVTAGSKSKLAHAKELLGVEGGTLYKEANWPKEIKQLILGQGAQGLDLVVDSAGGDIMAQSLQAGLRDGGKVVCYGMTAVPQIKFDMRAVLRNVDLLGSTMGSAQEFKSAIRFIEKHGIRPGIDTVLPSLDAATEGFALLADASKRQGGKVVVQVAPSPETLSKF